MKTIGGVKIDRANQVFALDTTYIPMARGFVYLTAVVDWASRKILAHRVAITLEAAHAVEALEEAFTRYGLPDIVNTDQGSQFTAGAFTDAVLGPCTVAVLRIACGSPKCIEHRGAGTYRRALQGRRADPWQTAR